MNSLECDNDNPVVGGDGREPEDDSGDGRPGGEEENSFLEQQIHPRTRVSKNLARQPRET